MFSPPYGSSRVIMDRTQYYLPLGSRGDIPAFTPNPYSTTPIMPPGPTLKRLQIWCMD